MRYFAITVLVSVLMIILLALAQHKRQLKELTIKVERFKEQCDNEGHHLDQHSIKMQLCGETTPGDVWIVDAETYRKLCECIDENAAFKQHLEIYHRLLREGIPE